MDGRGPPGREGYGGGRYDGRQGRYDRDRAGYDGGYRANGDSYGKRGRDGIDDGYGGPDDRRREYRGVDDDRRPRMGRSRSRSRPYEGYRGERYRYPQE